MSKEDQVKLAHSMDMVSTGICLNEREWFGEKNDRKKCRTCWYVVFTLMLTVIKVAAVMIVTNRLYSDYYDPMGEIINVTFFDKVDLEKAPPAGKEIDRTIFNLVSSKIYQTSLN
jgi:hypothetical protein